MWQQLRLLAPLDWLAAPTGGILRCRLRKLRLGPNTLTHNGCRVDATHATPRLASLIQFSVWFSCVLFGFSIYSFFFFMAISR